MPTTKLEKFRIKDEKGATAVEFAIIAALLFVILFGILEFALIFLQEHYVANAAREGVRIGVRANNYNTATFPYVGDDAIGTVPDASTCQTSTDRSVKIDCEIRRYLEQLYDWGSSDVTIDVLSTSATLEVTVTTDNFFPQIISNLVKILPGTSADFTLPDKISFKTTGDYEDQEEWEKEKP